MEGENRDSLWGRPAGFSAYVATLNLPFLLSDRLVRGKSRHVNREWTFQSRGGFLASNLLPISPGIRRAFEFHRVNSKASLSPPRPLDFDAFVEFIERIENLVRATVPYASPSLPLAHSFCSSSFLMHVYVEIHRTKFTSAVWIRHLIDPYWQCACVIETCELISRTVV